MVLNAVPCKSFKVTHIHSWFPCLAFTHSDLNLMSYKGQICALRVNTFYWIIYQNLLTRSYSAAIFIDPDIKFMQKATETTFHRESKMVIVNTTVRNSLLHCLIGQAHTVQDIGPRSRVRCQYLKELR